MMFALAAPVVALIVGFGIDLTRHQAARVAAQNSVDAAILAAAASGVRDIDGMKEVVETYLRANEKPGTQHVNSGYAVTVTQLNATQVRVTLSGELNAFFGGLIGMSQMPVNVNAVAERGAADGVELVMVLDNTWSMSASAGGATRIEALKSSARILVNALMADDADDVRFGVVPYAEYVNVGTANRAASWLSVPADYSTTSTPAPRVCTTKTVKNVCTGGVRGTCPVVKDGVVEYQACWTTPQTCSDQTVAPYESCTGGGNPSTTNYRWYGCVYSRNSGTLRLNDTRPEMQYKGFLGTSQTCLNPILTLTDQKSTVLSSINGLVVNVGNYKPETHIPSGLIWGVNVLSPTEPFSQGRPYSEGNRTPRKIMVLMTDGENTLRYNAGDGRHLTLNANATTAATQKAATNKDVADICVYAKSQGIEIYTVALSVTSETARSMLRTCASGDDHAFDATDSASLEASFAGIAASINAVRLVK